MRSLVGVLGALAMSLSPQASIAAGQVPVGGGEDGKLNHLFHDSNEASLKRNPLEAIQRGDLRYADRFGEPFTEAEWRADAAADRADLAALARIDRAKLTPVDQLAYDVFRERTERDLRGYAPAVRAIEAVIPLNHLGGLQVWYPRFASGEEDAPFKTVLDYENNLKRNAGYAAALDRAIGRYREGLAKGVTQPKLVVQNMIGEFDALIADGVDGSDFYAPVKTFPPSIPAAERARLTAAYAKQVREVIQPAHHRIRDFLATTYLPAARDSIGLSALPGGRAYYAYCIENQTTLQLDAEAAHQLGQDELARDTAELETLKTATGFAGTLGQFFDFLRTDKRFQPASGEQVREAYSEIARRVDLRVREQFSLVPKTPIEAEARAASQREGCGSRFLPRGHARWLTAGRLQLQYLQPAFAKHLDDGRICTFTRACLVTTSKSASRRRTPPFRTSCGSAATRPMLKAGGSTQRG